MKEFTINKNDADQRMDKFLTKAVPALPKNLLYKYIRLKRIKLNGKRCEISSRLSEGDKVQLAIDSRVQSYAGIPMNERYDSGELTVKAPEQVSKPKPICRRDRWRRTPR